jgi:hypothetical protein
MVTEKSTASPYRVDVVTGTQGTTYEVMNCQKVASFNNPEHAAFLVDLLTKGQAHD